MIKLVSQSIAIIFLLSLLFAQYSIAQNQNACAEFDIFNESNPYSAVVNRMLTDQDEQSAMMMELFFDDSEKVIEKSIKENRIEQCILTVQKILNKADEIIVNRVKSMSPQNAAKIIRTAEEAYDNALMRAKEEYYDSLFEELSEPDSKNPEVLTFLKAVFAYRKLYPHELSLNRMLSENQDHSTSLQVTPKPQDKLLKFLCNECNKDRRGTIFINNAFAGLTPFAVLIHQGKSNVTVLYDFEIDNHVQLPFIKYDFLLDLNKDKLRVEDVKFNINNNYKVPKEEINRLKQWSIKLKNSKFKLKSEIPVIELPKYPDAKFIFSEQLPAFASFMSRGFYRIEIITEPDDVEIYIDGDYQFNSPNVVVFRGSVGDEHKFLFTRDGFISQAKEYKLMRKKDRLEVVLVPTEKLGIKSK